MRITHADERFDQRSGSTVGAAIMRELSVDSPTGFSPLTDSAGEYHRRVAPLNKTPREITHFFPLKELGKVEKELGKIEKELNKY